MNTTVNRRGFIKAVSATAGTLALGVGSGASVYADETSSAKKAPAEAPVLSSVGYRPRAYPIQPKHFHEVMLKDLFWQPKMRRNAEVTIPFEIQKFQERQSPFGNNVLQAAIYSLQTYPDAKLQAQVESAIKAMGFEDESGRGPSNDNFEVAAAYYIASGRRDVLDRAIPAADAIYKLYQTTNPPFSGGERDAINCLALYGVTEDKRYLDLAKHYLDIRGLSNSLDRSRHNQSYKPVLEQGEAVGHAVNGASLMLSLVDVGTLTGIQDYFDAASRIWTDAVTTKLYITGGIGSTGNEGFGQPYSLPNLSAYAETCAAIMFTTFNHRMFLATGDSKYIDVMERAMYNNAIDGVGAAGDTFFYVNRLASASDGRNAALAARFAGMLPPEPGALHGVHAGIHLCAARRRALRQPLCFEPDRVQTRRQGSHAVDGERDAVGGQIEDHDSGQAARASNAQAENSRLGARTTCPQRSLLICGPGGAAGGDLGKW